MKAFEVSEYETMAANSKEEAIEAYIKEYGGDKDNMDVHEVDIDKKYMWFPLCELPPYYHRKSFERKNYEGEDHVSISLRTAMKYHRCDMANKPYMICVTSDLI